MTAALLTTVLLIAACGLIYELVAGALASYLLGDSVTQFSTVIGTYLFAMGIGSWLSRFIARGLATRFVLIEIMVGLVGGFSSALLFLAFAYTDGFRLLLYVLVLIVGILVGLEIPLLMRLLRDRFEFKDVVANVLTFDYLGALGASVLFPDRPGAPARARARADALWRHQRRRRAVDDGDSSPVAPCAAHPAGASASRRWRCSASVSGGRTPSSIWRRRTSTPTRSCWRERRPISGL